MKILNILENESEIFYRGISGVFDNNSHNTQHLTWVTNDVHLAKEYGDNILKFKLNFNRSFDFGFRDVRTHVKLEDMLSRILIDLTENTIHIIGEEKSRQVYNKINTLRKINKSNELKYVWEWYDTMPELTQILRYMGYDVIESREGNQNEIVTYGVINKSVLRKIN